jgi:positive regulator of sigma E activity
MDTIIPFVPASIMSFILFLIVGLLIGAAVKKAVVSAVLVILAALIASIAGFNMISAYSTLLLQHLPNIAMSISRQFGTSLDTLPIAFLIGLVLGLWKG